MRVGACLGEGHDTDGERRGHLRRSAPASAGDDGDELNRERQLGVLVLHGHDHRWPV